MATSNEYPEKSAWWINELKSLGIKQDEKNDELRHSSTGEFNG
jgi:hypothetical protein